MVSSDKAWEDGVKNLDFILSTLFNLWISGPNPDWMVSLKQVSANLHIMKYKISPFHILIVKSMLELFQ